MMLTKVFRRNRTRIHVYRICMLTFAAVAATLYVWDGVLAGCNAPDGTQITVTIGNLDRVPLYGTDPLGVNEKTVTVTVTPSPIPAGGSITLSCDPIAGTVGGATVTPSTITQTTDVKIRGTVQSWSNGEDAAPDSVELTAKVGDVVCATERFTVCAHPVNMCFEDLGTPPTAHYGTTVKVSWESDSGDVNDLDKCFLKETLFNFQQDDQPPFYGSEPDESPPVCGNAGEAQDEHGVAWGNVKCYTTGEQSINQTYKFKCDREQSDYTPIAGVYDIVYEVYESDSTWRIKQTISGPSSIGPSANFVHDVPLNLPDPCQ